MRKLKVLSSSHSGALEEWVNDFFKKCKDLGFIVMHTTYTCCTGAYVAYIEYDDGEDEVVDKRSQVMTDLFPKWSAKNADIIRMKDDPKDYNIVGE